MPFTRTCPRCGSVNVRKVEMDGSGGRGGRKTPKSAWVCQEQDCEEVWKVRGLSLTSRNHHTNTGWRDPVAMSMDGYDS